MRHWLTFVCGLASIATILFFSCGKKEDSKEKAEKPGPGGSGSEENGDETAEDDGCRGGATTSMAADVPDWIADHFECVTVTVSGDSVVIGTKSLPPYKSAYYGSDDSWYEAMPSGKSANPNLIAAQSISIEIPKSPTKNATLTATAMGPVGVAVNGVALFNNQAAPGDDLEDEMVSFDAGNGHPTNTGTYHYHIEPTKILVTGKELVGVMADGFPVYGTLEEDGSTPADLDDAHGHEHGTELFPDGIYHYHVTADDPYIIESFRGTPGSITQ